MNFEDRLENLSSDDESIEKILKSVLEYADQINKNDSEYMEIMGKIKFLNDKQDIMLRAMQMEEQKEAGMADGNEKKVLAISIKEWEDWIKERGETIGLLEKQAQELIEKSLIFNENGKDYSLSREVLTWFSEVVRKWQVGGETAMRQLSEELSDGFRDSIVKNEPELTATEAIAVLKLEQAVDSGISEEFKSQILDIIEAYEKVGNDTELIARAKELVDSL